MADKKSSKSSFGGCGILLLLAALAVGWAIYDARPKAAKFPLSIPPTAQLLNSFKHRGSFSDWTHAFEFSVKDGQLRDLLVREWKLSPYDDPIPAGWATGLSEYWSIGWWPKEEELTAAPERFKRSDDRQCYWIVWYDPAKERLYAEYGNW
jgi:hypothetical protein